MKFLYIGFQQVLIIEFRQQRNALMQPQRLIPELESVKDIGCSFIVGSRSKYGVLTRRSAFRVVGWIRCKDDFRHDAFLLQPFLDQICAIL